MNRFEDLRAALPGDFVGRQEPLQIDGAAASIVATPPTEEALAATLRAVGERGFGALICGGGTRLGLGNPPRRADLLLSTSGLSEIRELDADEGVLLAAAGTPLTLLREAAHAAGWQLPLDPPGSASTLGGALAAAAVGPRFGSPRQYTLGLSLVAADGTHTRFGARVVKNVTGYDLVKLHVGALGSLGVITSAWLRLLPNPEAVESQRVSIPWSGFSEAWVRVLEGARFSCVRVAAVDATRADADPLLSFELAGDAEAVSWEARELEKLLSTETDDSGRLAEIRALQDGSGATDEVSVALHSVPSQIPAVLDQLRAENAAVLAYPRRGELFAHFDGSEGQRSERIVRCLKRAAELGRGHYTVTSAPLKFKEGLDVFGVPDAQLPVFRNLKRAFDPDGVLNPGRFAGRL
ncbi:MAG: FAD-binding oxidoreductase [Myxococcales bacterium]|nr:FAD-binding oxidoreductase [Myxococcales bacterium]